MIELQGKYNKAKVFTDNIDNSAIAQIIELCNQEFVKGSTIRIMPDTHAGAGCTIGTTMTVKDKIVPNLVGVDIGCGMETLKLNVVNINFEALDKIIRNNVPAGYSIREDKHKFVDKTDIRNLKCIEHVNIDRAELSIGTLGGGNHFIEVNEDSNGNIYLVIHSGSRNLGKQVAEYYQNKAYERLTSIGTMKLELIEKLIKEGRQKEIQTELNKIETPKIKKELAYLIGDDMEDYIHDMKITQEFAVWNRKAIADTILTKMGFTSIEEFTTIHNYIDTEEMILRKGAISAKAEEKVVIPINMRDGSIIAVGKGNPDWNYSAPHGAGRLMSRSEAKNEVNFEDYKETMKDVWSTSVNENTIDESPMAYKSMDEIIENTRDTIEIIDIIRPLYNFKSS